MSSGKLGAKDKMGVDLHAWNIDFGNYLVDHWGYGSTLSFGL